MRSFALLRRIVLAKASLIVLALYVVLSSSNAHACPPGTVFSAFNGRGICAKVGAGATPSVICFQTRGGCPAHFDFEHKNSDPNHNYCCPEEIIRTSTSDCKQQCKPLLDSVTPLSEALRVFNNCVVGCSDPGGEITCPGGREVPVGTPCK